MTGVRSFDVKAYDNALAGYADLGWGDDVRSARSSPTSRHLSADPDLDANPCTTYGGPSMVPTRHFDDSINQTFAHEGRMPPLVEDNRLDAQYPNPTYVTGRNFTPSTGDS